MMLSQDHSPIVTPDITRKARRIRRLSTESYAPEDVIRTNVSDSQSSAQTTASVYEIRGILGERQSQFLIDWADSPNTGKKYSPSWEPKVNANSEAIRVWESKRFNRQNLHGTVRPNARTSRALRPGLDLADSYDLSVPLSALIGPSTAETEAESAACAEDVELGTGIVYDPTIVSSPLVCWQGEFTPSQAGSVPVQSGNTVPDSQPHQISSGSCRTCESINGSLNPCTLPSATIPDSQSKLILEDSAPGLFQSGPTNLEQDNNHRTLQSDSPDSRPSQATTTDESGGVHSKRNLNLQELEGSFFQPSVLTDNSKIQPFHDFDESYPQDHSASEPLHTWKMATSSVPKVETGMESQPNPETSDMSLREKMRAQDLEVEALLTQSSQPSNQRPARPGQTAASLSSINTLSSEALASQEDNAHTAQDLAPENPLVTSKFPPADIAQSDTQQAAEIQSFVPESSQVDAALENLVSTVSQTSRGRPYDPVRESSLSYDTDPPKAIEADSSVEAVALSIPSGNDNPINIQYTLHTPTTPSKLSLQNEMALSSSDNILEPCAIGENEHIVSLSMPPRIQQHYRATIRFYADAIKTFLDEKDCTRDILGKINSLLDELVKVTTHIDLQGSGPASQEPVDPKREAAYAESCSEKFAFLGRLLDQIEGTITSMAIVARPGPLTDILKMYLTGKNTKYSIDEASASKDSKVSLLRSDILQIRERPANEILVAFDETAQLTISSQSALSAAPPFIRPIVVGSAEHVDLCISRSGDPLARLRRLVLVLLQAQRTVGVLGPDEPNTSTFAALVALRGFDRLGIRPIRDIALLEVQSGTIIDCDTPNKLRFWPNVNARTEQTSIVQGPKRPRDSDASDDNESLNKRLKFAEGSEDQGQAAEAENIAHSAASLPLEIKTQLRDLKQQLEKKNRFVKELQQWASIRQHEFEKLRKEHSDLQLTASEATDALNTSSQTALELHGKLNILRDDNSEMRKEMSELRTQLNSHPDSSVAAKQQEREERENLEKENAVLQKRIASIQETFEFTKEQYQQATTRAVELQGELESLQSEVTSLRRKNEANIAEHHRLRDVAVTKELHKEINRLRQVVKQRDRFTNKLEVEMIDLKRGRAGVQTRGSSVQPKSPGARSRGVSPAASMLGGHGMVRGSSGLGNRFNA